MTRLKIQVQEEDISKADAWDNASAVAGLEPVASASPDAPASPHGRPSLEVAIETHRNLLPRVESLCVRLLGWRDQGVELCNHAAVALSAMKQMGEELAKLQASGFVAKSTPKSRMEARLATMQPVKLRDEVRAKFSRYYGAEELDDVQVVGRDDDGLWVKLGRRENALPIPLKLSDLIPG